MRGNVFEHQVIQISGEAYLEDVAVCGLQPGAAPELRLCDTCLGQPVEASFHIRNASVKHFRCWPTSSWVWGCHAVNSQRQSLRTSVLASYLSD